MNAGNLGLSRRVPSLVYLEPRWEDSAPTWAVWLCIGIGWLAAWGALIGLIYCALKAVGW